jgi:hypothetical protein
VTRSSGNGNASVRYATADGSATAAAGDYQPASGTVSFAQGETRQTVTVLVTGDRVGEGDESFLLTLSNPSGGNVLADAQGTAAVVDDEPRVFFTNNVVVEEGDDRTTVHMAVNLSVPSSQTVTVNYATADETAITGEDYLSAAGTLTFTPGQTQRKVDIELTKDKKAEPIVEAFFVNLSNASANGVMLGRGVVHIIDNDVSHGNGNALTAASSVTFSRLRIASAGSNSASALLDGADDDDAVL